MKVKWHHVALVQRKQVSTYIRREFGTVRERKFKQKVNRVVEQLMKSPNIGQIDPLFADRPNTYRSVIINGLNKLVYYTDGNTLHIAAFWDTRSEPQSQVLQTE